MLLFSDLHLRDESADLVLGEVLPGILEKAGPKETIACLGDVLHFRYRVPAPLLNGLRDWCLRATNAGHQLIFLPGNHDQYTVGGRNALEPLASISGVKVYTDPAHDEYGLWIPYRKNPFEVRQALTDLASRSPQASLCFIHHGVLGSWMNDHVQCKEGLDPSEFGGLQVFSGHYHKHHTVGHVTYVGSPYQTNAGESGQPKGFIRLQPGDGQWVFYPMDWGKRYHRIDLSQGEALNLADVRDGDEVRVKTGLGVDPVVVGKQLVKLGVTHTVTPELAHTETRLQVEDSASMREFAGAYVDAIAPEGLDPNRLLQTFEELTQ